MPASLCLASSSCGTVAWRGVSMTVQPLRAASWCSTGLSPATQISGSPLTGREAMCVSGSR